MAIGMLLPSKFLLGFTLGFVVSGFYLAINTSLTSALLQSSKEWCLLSQKFTDVDYNDVMESENLMK